MANPYELGPLAGGAEKLVGALLGGDEVQAAAQQKEAMRLTSVDTANATLDKKITDAYMARDKRKALQGVQAQYEAMGDDPMVAALKASAHIGGFGNIEQAQRFGLRDEAATALRADPNFTPANAALAALAGKPVAGVASVAGQNVTGLYGAAPVIENNDETMSKILANEARAGASRASASVSEAKAATGGWNPATGARRVGTKLEDAQAIVDELRADPEYDMTGIDAKVVADRIRTHGSFVPPKRAAGNVRLITPKGYTDTATVPPAKDSVPTINTPAEKGIYQELLDAREAIARGQITREAAKKRLIANGLANIAGQL